MTSIGATSETVRASLQILNANRRVMEKQPYYQGAVKGFQDFPWHEAEYNQTAELSRSAGET